MSSLRVHGCELAYRETGRGPALILGHGLYLDGEMYLEAAQRLASSWRVIRVDFRGHGASHKPRAPLSLEDLADDVAALADALAIPRFAYAGLSMGGMVGMRLALRHPGRLLGLALLDTSAQVEPQREMFEAWAEGFRGRPVGEADADGFLMMAAAEAYRAAAPASLARLRAQVLCNEPEGIYHTTLAVLRRQDIRDALAAIDLPALVVVGREDRLTPPLIARNLVQALRGAEYYEVPGAGHLSILEAPELVLSRLEAFLGRTVAPGAAP